MVQGVLIKVSLQPTQPPAAGGTLQRSDEACMAISHAISCLVKTLCRLPTLPMQPTCRSRTSLEEPRTARCDSLSRVGRGNPQRQGQAGQAAGVMRGRGTRSHRWHLIREMQRWAGAGPQMGPQCLRPAACGSRPGAGCCSRPGQAGEVCPLALPTECFFAHQDPCACYFLPPSLIHPSYACGCCFLMTPLSQGPRQSQVWHAAVR